MVKGHERETPEEKAKVTMAFGKKHEADESIPEEQVDKRGASENEKGSAIVCHEAALCQRIAERNPAMAKMAFSPQQQEADQGDLMVQRKVMSTGGTDTIQGNKGKVLADPVFYSAEISTYDQAEQRTAKEKNNKKIRIRHGNLLLPKSGGNKSCRSCKEFYSMQQILSIMYRDTALK